MEPISAFNAFDFSSVLTDSSASKHWSTALRAEVVSPHLEAIVSPSTSESARLH